MTRDGATARKTPGPSVDADCERTFEVFNPGHYGFCLDALGISFEVDRLRRVRDELVCELTVRCELAGARVVEGVLSVADLNLSVVRAREERARYLGTRAYAADIDWTGLLEELAQRVIRAERAGTPSVSLRDLPRPAADTTWSVKGFPVLARHPMCVFGDGGAAKSYFALFCAGELARAGRSVVLFDWELAGDDHRVRLEALYGADMPNVRYLRCDRPLAHMIDQVKRVVREDEAEFAIFDSVAFACDGPPEAAEVAGRYFGAVRQIGPIGSLHIAHVSKAKMDNDQSTEQRPFGSTFWHNGARATWFAKLAETNADGSHITVGLFNRKANLGARHAPLAFEVAFGADITTFKRTELADVPELATRLTIGQRIRHSLKRGTLSREALVAEHADDARPDTIQRAIRRGITRGELVEFPTPQGPRLGLRAREDRP